MCRSFYNSLSGIWAFQRSLEITADNLANINSTAFKRSEAAFGDLLYHALREKRFPVGQAAQWNNPFAGAGVRVASITPALEQGQLIHGGRPLDLAIEGEGYFRITRGDGDQAYTRQGSFFVDAAGRLVTSQGHYLDVNFSLEGIPAERLTISQEGEVAHLDENGLRVELGTINLYRFTNPAGLIKDPNQQQLIASEASGEPREGTPGEEGFGKIQQYYLEGSNVSLSVEMAALLQTKRSLQANSRTLQVADELRAMTLQLRT